MILKHDTAYGTEEEYHHHRRHSQRKKSVLKINQEADSRAELGEAQMTTDRIAFHHQPFP